MGQEKEELGQVKGCKWANGGLLVVLSRVVSRKTFGKVTLDRR